MLASQIATQEGQRSCTIRLRALSLGAGVQSTTMALMATHGEIGPMPDCAIFADTGWEPKAVYKHLDWLMSRKRSPTHAVVEAWIGISTDEIIRAKASFEPWQVKRFPLIEQRMSRRDCLAWLRRHDYPEPPKSACIGCPFHDNGRWRYMRDHDVEAWVDAVEIDRALRTGLRGIRGEVFLRRSCVPLEEADLSTAADYGQLDLFANECEGMCGV